MANGSNYTTILEELSPEIERKIRNISRQNSNLPANVYSEQRLLSANCAIRREISEPDSLMPLHIHDFLVLTYFRQAEGYEYLVGSNRYRLHSGVLIRIPQGVPHRPISTQEAKQPLIQDELWLRNDFIHTFGRRLPENFPEELGYPYLFSGSSVHWKSISQLFQKGVQESEEKDFRWEAMIDAYAMMLLVIITRAMLDDSTKIIHVEQPNLFDRVMTYLKENLDQKLVLEDIAAHFYVSKSTLNRTFRKHLGNSFYNSVTQLRLLAAQQLIMEGVLLETVSRKVGFADYPTFYRAFRKEFGISPQRFKKEYYDGNQKSEKNV